MRFIALLTLLVVYCVESAFAVSSYLSFKRYQVEEGLSHNTVWCAIQDSYGFVWFGTSDGLNCYNGRTNKVYRNVLNDKYSLENNFVQALFEEENGNIWVGTNWGLYVYDRSNDRFTYFDKRTSYGVPISSEIKKIIKTNNGLIWIATLGQGLFIYNPKTDVLLQNSLYTSFVWDMCESAQHLVYASSLQDGLFCFDENGTLLKLPPELFAISDNSGNYKINSVENIKGTIWLGADNNMLYKWNERTGVLDSYNVSPITLGTVRCMLDYSESELLIGTDNGLFLFNQKNGSLGRADTPSGIGGLSDQSVNDILKDTEGGIWVMTNLGGVNYASKQTKHFESYSSTDQFGENTGVVVGPFCEDATGNIWIGARDGLYFFNTENRQLIRHPIGRLGNRKYDIRALYLDGDKLWIGTSGEGLKVYDIRTGAVKEYSHSRDVLNTICSNDVLSVYKAHNGTVYIGTSWGLCRYNAEDDNFSVVNAIGTMISVIDILEDMYGNLWVATSNSGVFRCRLKQKSDWRHFEHKREDSTTITNNYVIALFEDVKGTVWFGTNGGGLCSFDPEKEIFVDFDPQNVLLPSKVIYSMEQDKVGDFWISSNAGLIKINPATKEHFRRFTVTDGLQGNQFNAHSSLKASNGKFYFGGINGFNAFTPEQFTDNEYIPPVYITDIQFPYTTDEHLVQDILHLEEPLYIARKITLPYEYNSFAISFAALSYEDPSKNRYSYMLKGVDKEWVVNSKTNMASYTNLPPGEYEFVVRGSNNDNKWNLKGATITVVITPPWWRTTWAYCIYILILLTAACYIALRWDRYVKLRYKRRMDEFRITKEKEIYESKINFFINLVHEIRTPLSLIFLPLEKLMDRKQTPEDTKYLSVIDKNVSYLLGVTNQLLDFQKMESGSLQLNLQICNVNQLIDDVYNQFIGPAELKGILLTMDVPDENICALIDQDKIHKILVNLVGNAIKFARSRIELKLFKTGENFEIQVNDDGAGIPDEERGKVFEAFYQVENHGNAKVGTGIGLAFSKSLAEAHHGKLKLEKSQLGGSSFILDLPVGEVDSAKKVETMDEKNAQIVVEEENNISNYPVGKYTVLLVEDNIDLLNLTKDSLSANFRVLKAENGREALEVLQHESVDVIVSDVMMPEMDGLELTTNVKADINHSHIPIILLTAKTTLESKVEGFECGADAYIEKPFSVRQLRMQIENLLKLRQAFHKMMTGISGSQPATTSEYALSQKDCEFIARIQEVVSEQLSDENFSIDSLAEMMHMSRSNFYRKIKALSGMAPNDYLKTLRLNRAAELIRNGERIAEVCERVGFTSSSYFAKCFKTQFGVLPRDYKG